MSDKDRKHRRDANLPRPALTFDKIREAAKAMKDEPSLDPRKSCTGMFCGAVQKLKFWGGKRRTKKRRKKRRTKSRRKTKRRRKSRRRTKRRRRKR
tara:strand:+ start:313 stop:600 length:288 start_codon:yes stop_codon:yes gene_type:complete